MRQCMCVCVCVCGTCRAEGPLIIIIIVGAPLLFGGAESADLLSLRDCLLVHAQHIPFLLGHCWRYVLRSGKTLYYNTYEPLFYRHDLPLPSKRCCP